MKMHQQHGKNNMFKNHEMGDHPKKQSNGHKFQKNWTTGATLYLITGWQTAFLYATLPDAVIFSANVDDLLIKSS
jgi:hypothetical protein